MRRLMIGTFGAAICAVSLAARAGTGLARNEPRVESSRAAPRELVAVYVGDGRSFSANPSGLPSRTPARCRARIPRPARVEATGSSTEQVG